MKTLVLLSGGLDSVTALYRAAQDEGEFAALSFDYGARHHARELPLAQWHCRRLNVRQYRIDLPFMDRLFDSCLLKSGGEVPLGNYRPETMRKTVVPFRNGILLASAAGLAESLGAREVLLSAHSGDHAIYPDCRPAFLQAMAEAIRLGTYAGITLCAPFQRLSKADIVRIGTDLGVDYARTWSCYRGGEKHCGRCGTCRERRAAFAEAGIPDPTEYEDG